MPLLLPSRRRHGLLPGPALASAAGATPLPAPLAAPFRPAACPLQAGERDGECMPTHGHPRCNLRMCSSIMPWCDCADDAAPAVQLQHVACGLTSSKRWHNTGNTSRHAVPYPAHPVWGRTAWACPRRLGCSTPLPGSTASAACAHPCPAPAPSTHNVETHACEQRMLQSGTVVSRCNNRTVYGTHRAAAALRHSGHEGQNTAAKCLPGRAAAAWSPPRAAAPRRRRAAAAAT